MPIQDIARLQATSGLRVLERASERTIYLGMDQAREELLDSNLKGVNPFKDRRVREALYRAIDVKAIIEKIMRGHATPTGQLHAPSLRGFVPELNDRIPYDLRRARELLDEAGYSQGFPVGIIAQTIDTSTMKLSVRRSPRC